MLTQMQVTASTLEMKDSPVTAKPLGKVANDTINSFIRDMANEQDPVNQVYTWGADADCDQISVTYNKTLT